MMLRRLLFLAALLALGLAAPCQQDLAVTTTTTTTTLSPCQQDVVTTTTTTMAPCVEKASVGPCLNDLGQKIPCVERQKEDLMPQKVNWTDYDCTRLQQLEDALAAAREPIATLEPVTTTTTTMAMAPTTTTTTTTMAPTTTIPKEVKCKDGWLVYKESCYYIEKDAKTLQTAERACIDKKATLVVFDSMDEFDKVMKEHNVNTWTWTGLFKEQEDREAHYHSSAGMDYKKLPWLIQPYSHSGNGWTAASQGAAYWNPSTELGKYIFWYPTSYSFASVCEYNSTLAVETDAKKFF